VLYVAPPLNFARRIGVEIIVYRTSVDRTGVEHCEASRSEYSRPECVSVILKHAFMLRFAAGSNFAASSLLALLTWRVRHSCEGMIPGMDCAGTQRGDCVEAFRSESNVVYLCVREKCNNTGGDPSGEKGGDNGT